MKIKKNITSSLEAYRILADENLPNVDETVWGDLFITVYGDVYVQYHVHWYGDEPMDVESFAALLDDCGLRIENATEETYTIADSPVSVIFNG